jgi:Zn-dependent M28 family amino/carboxypeptidase
VADLNVDMFLPLIPLRRMIVFGENESDLGPLIRYIAAGQGVEVQPDPEPLKTRFIRSDQYSFIRRGVPSVAFKCGYEIGTAEETLMTTWLHERYHAPSDDLAQPVDRSCAGKFNQILFAAMKAVADRPESPRWNEESFFRRLSAPDVNSSAPSSDARMVVPPRMEPER